MALQDILTQGRLVGFSILALFAFICGVLSAKTASQWSIADEIVSGYGFLSFDGFFTFIWCIGQLALSLTIGKFVGKKDNVDAGPIKWVVGPIALIVQLFILWILWVAGAGNASRLGICTRFDGCKTLAAAVAFAWLNFILLLALIGATAGWAFLTSKSHGGFRANASTAGQFGHTTWGATQTGQYPPTTSSTFPFPNTQNSNPSQQQPLGGAPVGFTTQSEIVKP